MKYLLPKELGGGEYEADDWEAPMGSFIVQFTIPGLSRPVRLDIRDLTEVKPAKSDDPEPDAEFILLELDGAIVPRIVAQKTPLMGWVFVGGNAADRPGGRGYDYGIPRTWEALRSRFPNAKVTPLVPKAGA